MSTPVATVPTQHAPPATVLTCYELLHACLAGGISDFTEGKYVDARSDAAAYAAAQHRQAEYLLDEIACTAGSRILDIGCGYGRILRQAAERGATAIGITISPPQVRDGRRQGLEIYGLNYRDLDDSWTGRFDGAVANGSLEHFAQVEDACQGRVEAIYREMFAIVRRVLRPAGRLVTTAIHFREPEQVLPEALAQGPHVFPRGSDEYHFSMVLQRTFGGWYPFPGQLKACAQPHFRLVREEDGTEDYHRTSEYWLRRLQRSLVSRPAVWLRLAETLLRRPRATRDMLRCLLRDQSWMWQFRPSAPTRLLRQTWEAV